MVGTAGWATGVRCSPISFSISRKTPKIRSLTTLRPLGSPWLLAEVVRLNTCNTALTRRPGSCSTFAMGDNGFGGVGTVGVGSVGSTAVETTAAGSAGASAVATAALGTSSVRTPPDGADSRALLMPARCVRTDFSRGRLSRPASVSSVGSGAGVSTAVSGEPESSCCSVEFGASGSGAWLSRSTAARSRSDLRGPAFLGSVRAGSVSLGPASAVSFESDSPDVAAVLGDSDPALSEPADSVPVVSAHAAACTGANTNPAEIATAAAPYPNGLTFDTRISYRFQRHPNFDNARCQSESSAGIGAGLRFSARDAR